MRPVPRILTYDVSTAPRSKSVSLSGTKRQSKDISHCTRTDRSTQIHSLLKPLLEKFGHHILADILSRFTFVRIQKAASNNPPSIRDICPRFLCACIPGMHERNPEDPKSPLSTAESSPPAAIGQVDDHRDKSHSLRQQRSRPTERTGE